MIKINASITKIRNVINNIGITIDYKYYIINGITYCCVFIMYMYDYYVDISQQS